jgi:hypothetical protein
MLLCPPEGGIPELFFGTEPLGSALVALLKQHIDGF